MIPIYVKSTYSFLESFISIDDLVSFGKKNQLNYLCICDDNLYGSMEFINKCLNNNITPIVGLDIGICLLYAKNYDGFINLIKINNLKEVKEIEPKDLEKYQDNLLCLTKNDNEFKNIFKEIYLYSDDKNQSNYLKKIKCLNKEDVYILKYLYLLKENKTVADDISFDEDCYYEDNNYFNFFDKCSFTLPNYPLLLPMYDKYNDTKNLSNDEYLANLSINGLYKRLKGKITEEYKNRLLYELDIIKKMGYANYFLIVYDYIKYAKKNDILVGPGRGSAAGSLVAYSIGITDVDPIKYHLLFERFLNIERISMPDIDTDFPYDKRDDIINYCINKYGNKQVAGIITFNTFGANLSIRDIGRVLRIQDYILNDLLKKIDNSKKLIEQSNREDIKILLQSDNKLKKCYDIASKIEGIPKNSSIHASGIVISSLPLNDIVPINLVNDRYIVEYSSEYLEQLGLLKMDFLANKNLTIVKNTLDYIKKYEKQEIFFSEIPLDDNKTYQTFCNGETLGIFQFEKYGMQEFLKKLKPCNFKDIYNANAFYRPGPSVNIPTFLKRREKKEKVSYYDDSLKNILEDTEGIIVYQEQVMQIAHVIANFSMGEADILRRAISKKKIEDINKMKDKFINNALNNGYKKEIVTEIFDYIEKFAGYGFNKSHSVAYSLLSYKMAYLKTNYPKYFYLSMLNNIGNDIKVPLYIKEMKRRNVKIMKPNINKSSNEYIMYYDYILLPLNIIKGVSNTISKKIIDSRDKGFIDIYQFFITMVQENINLDIIKNIIMAGCLDELYNNRHTLIDNLDTLMNYSMLVKKLGYDYVLKPDINKIQEYPKDVLINNEKDIFGFYLSNHPVNMYKNNVKNSVNLSDIKKYYNKRITCVGMVDRIKEITTKKGELMAFINISDEDSSCSVTLFPKIYHDIKIKNSDIMIIEGKVEKRIDYEIIADKIINVKEIV